MGGRPHSPVRYSCQLYITRCCHTPNTSLRSGQPTLEYFWSKRLVLRGCIDPSLQISTPGDRTPVAPVPQVCHRPGTVRACVQRAHGVADYHLFSMWRCWPFATLLANAPERCVRCADRECHRERLPRGERMRVSTARRRGGVRERCGEAFARQRAVRRTAAIVERESPFPASFARGAYI